MWGLCSSDRRTHKDANEDWWPSCENDPPVDGAGPETHFSVHQAGCGCGPPGSQKVLFTTGHILPRHKLFYRLSRGAAFISTGNISLSFSLNRIKNICRSLLKFNKSLYQFRLKKIIAITMNHRRGIWNSDGFCLTHLCQRHCEQQQQQRALPFLPVLAVSLRTLLPLPGWRPLPQQRSLWLLH